MQQYFSRLWWENYGRYKPWLQRLFLRRHLSVCFPAMVNLEPTNRCNLSCGFCPRARSGRKDGLMPGKLYEKIINELAEMRLAVLWLNKDGEPLLHPRLAEMVKLAKSRETARRVEIYSNGWLLDEPVIRDLIESGLDSLVVSLDATSPKQYAGLKGKDGLAGVEEKVRRFMYLKRKTGRVRPLVSVKTVDWSEDETDRFVKRWKGVVDNVLIQKLHDWEGSLRISNIKDQKSKIKRYPCNLPWLAPAVNWDGKVVPCCVNYRENELVMGDLRRESLTMLWRGDKLKKLRQAHLRLDFSGFPTCRGCRYWQQLPDMSGRLRRLGV